METTYRIGFDSRSASQRAKAFRRELELTERSTERLDRQTGLLGASYRQLSGALIGVAGVAGFSKVVRDVSTLENINARLATLTGNLAGEQDFLRRTAVELSASYVGLAQGYSKLLPLQQAGLLTSKESREITIGLANAQAATGASAAQLGQSMFGLAQGLSAGTLRAEELNQITEPLPGLLQALDRASGQAAGGFRKLVVDGKVTSDLFRNTLLVALRDYEGSAANLSGNIAQSFERVNTQYTILIDELSAPINSALVPFANTLESVLTNVSENADEYIATLGFVTKATAAAFGARALGELNAYGAQRIKNAATSLQEAKANAVLAQSNAAEAASKVRQAAAAADYAAIQLRETQVRAASITGIQRLTFVTTELAAAERAAAVATGNLAVTQKAASASALTLSAAQAKATISARALASAVGLARGAMAFLGGPLGVAALAAYGVYQFVDSLESQEDAAKATTRSLEEIAEGYRATGEEAEAAARKTFSLAEAEIEAAQARLAALQADSTASSGNRSGLGGNDIQIAAVQKQIDERQKLLSEARIKFRNELAQSSVEAMAAIDAGLSSSIGDIQASADELFSKLFPSDQKKAELETQLAEVRALFSQGVIDSDQLRRAEGEINRRLTALAESSAQFRSAKQAQDELSDATKDYNDIVSEFNPDLESMFAYEEQVEKLKSAQAAGAITVVQYQKTLGDLDRSLGRELIDNRIEAERELRDLLHRDIDNSGIDDYNDSMLLLNRALQDTPQKADQINQAIARLNESFVEAQAQDLSGLVNSFDVGDTGLSQSLLQGQQSEREALEQQLDQRRATIMAYQESEYADKVAVHQALLNLDAAAARAEQALTIQQQAERVDAISSADAQVLAESRATSEFRRDAAIQAGTSVEQAEAAHQGRLAAIREFAFDAEALKRQYESGQLAATEYHARREQLETEHQERLAGIQRSGSIAQFDREIGLANSLFDIYESSLGRKSDRALTAAKEAREIADDATGSEKQALEEQAQQAEAFARKRFNDEKKASIAQARVQQALAVVKAWTSGATIYDQILNAGIAFAGTEQVIQDLKSQQFNGGSSLSSSNSNSGSSGSTGGGDNANLVNGQDIGTGAGNTYNFLVADEIVDKEKLKQEYVKMTDELSRNGTFNGVQVNSVD